MSDFLNEMAAESRRRADEVASSPGQASLGSRAASAPPPLPLRPAPEGFDVIAEAKLASPSEGRLSPGGRDEVVALATEYVANGAAAVSILTEESRFAGSMDHLEAVATAVDAPVMRKDFLVDPIQVTEARASGASGVLLIARMLPGGLLSDMADLALSLGMFVLVEIFDLADLELSHVVFDRDVLIGVNSRDLTTLEVDPERFAMLAPDLPANRLTVAESGLATTTDVERVVGLGYGMALVGSSLVTGRAPGERLGAMISAGRAAMTGAGT